jgi:hypothetical protein
MLPQKRPVTNETTKASAMQTSGHQRPRDTRPQARKKRILARAAALSSQHEGIRCEHIKELIRDAAACGINIEREIFLAAYGDPEGRKYWESHLSESLSLADFADLLSAHLVGQDAEESQNAIIAALEYSRGERLVPFFGGWDPRADVQWLLDKPKRAHLVPLSLRLFLSTENRASFAQTTGPGLVSWSPAKRGRKPETLNRVQQAMRSDIQSGRHTEASLKSMLEKNLAEQYGVSRDTARKARAMVLSKKVENSNRHKKRQTTNSDID